MLNTLQQPCDPPSLVDCLGHAKRHHAAWRRQPVFAAIGIGNLERNAKRPIDLLQHLFDGDRMAAQAIILRIFKRPRADRFRERHQSVEDEPRSMAILDPQTTGPQRSYGAVETEKDIGCDGITKDALDPGTIVRPDSLHDVRVALRIDIGPLPGQLPRPRFEAYN